MSVQGDADRRGIRGSSPSACGLRLTLGMTQPATAEDASRAYPATSSADDPAKEVLDKIQAGRAVKIKLRPLTLRTDAMPRLSSTIVAYPKMRTADTELRGPVAKRELRRLECMDGPRP